jgi:hypothetical protein
MNHFRAGFPHSSSLYIIARSKAGAFKHVGILLPDGRVAHCSPECGEHISTVETFAMGQDVATIEEITKRLRALTLRRIAEAMRTPLGYHATNNNCEMFVNRMLGRNVTSPQLNVALVITGIALVAFAVAA